MQSGTVSQLWNVLSQLLTHFISINGHTKRYWVKIDMRPSQMELKREKEKAQRERAKMRTEENNVHIPKFPSPRRTTEKDDRIEQLLGPHSVIIKSLTMDDVGISSQPQTPLPNKSKFFDSSVKRNDLTKNGIKQIQPNTSKPKPLVQSLIKPVVGRSEVLKKSQNLTEYSKSQTSISDSKCSDHLADSSNAPNVSHDVKDISETLVHSKTKKHTKHSSHKSPRRSSSSSDQEPNHIKSTLPKPLSSEKPKPLGNSTKQFPPPNGINRPPKNKLPKLSISGQNEVHHDVDAILQEMTNLKQPLTAISTPQKDDHFPFPNSLETNVFLEKQNTGHLHTLMKLLTLNLNFYLNLMAAIRDISLGRNKGRNLPLLKNFPEQPSKINKKKNDLKEEALDISLISYIEPLITPPETPIKPPPPPQPCTVKCDSVHEDLLVSESEDELKDESNLRRECPTLNPCKRGKIPVKEPRASISSDKRASMSSDISSSSESGNESDSSSDDSESSSEDEVEKQPEVTIEKVVTPPKSPVKGESSMTWSLGNFMSKVGSGDKYPKPPSVGSDDRNDNDELLQDIVTKLIKSPSDSFTAKKSPNSSEKSPYEQVHSHSSSACDFHSPPSVQSTPSKSSRNGITPSKQLTSDNSDSEIDVVSTPLKKVSLLSPIDQCVAKCLNFDDSHSYKQTAEKCRTKRQSLEGSIIGSLSSDDDEEETVDNDNNNDSMCNLQEIIHSVGTNRIPLSPIPHEPEKVPKRSPCVKKKVYKYSLKYNDGKPSIIVRLDLKNITQFLKDRIIKSPYRDKVDVSSKSEEKTDMSYLDVDEKATIPSPLETSFQQDTTANTEPVEMELDSDSDMANSHIEYYTKTSSTPSSTTQVKKSDKYSKYSERLSNCMVIKRKTDETDKRFPKRRKSTTKTTNKSTETVQKEKDSHEDDHKWDRKHPPRSGSKDRVRNSSSSSQTDTEKPTELDLVAELNAQTNSDAHPSSVETIFNREGDGEIIHEPVLRKQIKRPVEPLEKNDVYLSRARELKHQAETLVDQLSKYLLYTESMLSFIMRGYAMEKEQRKATDIFKMYSDTFKWISHIYRTRNNAETSDAEKKLAVLIYRIQSHLCLKLYKLKRAEALKFKKIIDEHNKTTSSKPSAHAPSPHWNNRSTPSPMSPSPSPAGSVGSVGSQGSSGEFTLTKLPNGNITSQTAMSSPGTVAVPQRIHSITQQYLSNIHNLVQCHEFWDQADTMYNDHKEFYEDIDDHCGTLTLDSSVPDLVYYVQNGLQKIKDNT